MNLYKLKSCLSINFIFGKIILFLLPFVLILILGRLLTTYKFLEWEYKKSSFPSDKFGFSTSDRLKYGPKFLDYWYKDKDISYLDNLTFANGKKLLNERELDHMKDVKKVIQIINKLRLIFVIIFIFSILFLMTNYNSRFILFKNLFYGSIFSIFFVFIISIISLFSFNFFFNLFHKFLGFSSGTWIFYESDTLIRLFPLKLWFDGFVLLLGLVLGSSFILAFISWFFSRIKLI